MRNKVLIYADYGCSNINILESGLREYFEPRKCTVDLTDAAGIISRNELDESVLAFFMPGGAGTPFRRKLEVQGNGKIRDFVRNGGIYCGICAGAYYACRRTIFEADIPELKIISECGLNLIEGQAVGTLYKELGILPYAKNAGAAAAVEIEWQDKEKHLAYYHGGPYFELDNPAEYEILARYNFGEKPPAIVEGRYHKGKVIISGVHFEDSGQQLKKAIHCLRIDSDIALQIADKLTAGENSRQALFDKIMSRSGR